MGPYKWEEPHLETTINWQWARAASTRSFENSWKPVIIKSIAFTMSIFDHDTLNATYKYALEIFLYPCSYQTGRKQINHKRYEKIAWLRSGLNHLPPSGLLILLRFWAQATAFLAALASNAPSTALGFNQSSAASNQMTYN